MTLFLVLDICASNGVSWNWFTAFAAEDKSPVPAVHKMKVLQSNGAGATAYPAIVVTTTKAVNNHTKIHWFVMKWENVRIILVSLIFDNFRYCCNKLISSVEGVGFHSCLGVFLDSPFSQSTGTSTAAETDFCLVYSTKYGFGILILPCCYTKGKIFINKQLLQLLWNNLPHL